MSRTAAQVSNDLMTLLPRGWAMPEGDPNTFWAAMLAPLASELAQLEQSMESFEVELDPGTAENLFPDYLRVLGPDPYGWDALPLSSAQRAQLAHNRWVDAPIICPGYFVEVADSVGIPITITEFPRTPCGILKCGTRPVPSPQHCVFQVTLATDNVWTSKCGGMKCGSQISGFTPSVIEPFIRDKAPLYSQPVFSYT